MLLIQNVTIKDLKDHCFIESFSYSLGNKEKVGIIGEEGNGKSTLLKWIKDPKSIEDYTVVSGTMDTDKQHIAYFEQQISSTWNDTFIYEYLLKEHVDDVIETERYNELGEFEELSRQLFLPKEFIQRDQCIATLSGGERIKLQLLKLMHNPMDLLLLDEPTNDLDIETKVWLEQFLMKLEIPVMFISHDEVLLTKVATQIIHIEQLNKKTKSKVSVFRGNYQEYITQRGRGRDKEVQIARKEKQEYIKKKIALNDQQNAVRDALNDTVRNPGQAAQLKRKMRNIKAQERRFEATGYHHVHSVEEALDVYFPSTQLPQSKHIVDVHFDKIMGKDQVLLQDVDLFVKGSDKLVITGCNGSGKSMLIKQLYEVLKVRQDLRVCYMPQQYADLFDALDTPITFLLEEGDHKDVTITRELLGRMKFTSEEMQHSLLELSEGQKAKLYLIKAIKQHCTVLLLDEPTRNLSPLSGPAIRLILSAFDGCIIAISHDRMLIEEVFDRQLHIQDQHLVEVESS